MESTDTELLERYRAAAAVLAELPNDVALYRIASEATLLEANLLFAKSQVSLRTAGALSRSTSGLRVDGFSFEPVSISRQPLSVTVVLGERSV
jgi:hypothetical protein